MVHSLANPYKRICDMVCMSLFAMVCMLGMSTANASILLPQDAATDFDQLLSQLEAKELAEAEGGTSSSDQAATASEVHQVQPDKNQKVGGLLARAHSPIEGSMSSTSTSTFSGPNASSSSMLYSDSAAAHPDLILLGWVQGDARFSLPEPPGNGLLRPPQV